MPCRPLLCALDPPMGYVMRHAELHLVGRIGSSDGRRGLDAGVAGPCHNPTHEYVAQNDVARRRRAETFHAAPAFIRSCRWTMPTSLRPPSSTGSAMMPCCSISRIAAPASASGVVLFGVRVMTSRTGMSRKWSVRSMSRVRSPAVTTPTRLPAASTTATVPRFSASSTTHSRIGRSGPRAGTLPASMTSATRSNKWRPNVPPGWSAANCSRRNPLTSSSVTARASPSASAAVVLVVGASVSGHASSVTLASRTTSDWRASGESGSPVSAMIGTPRPRSVSSLGSVRDIATLQEVFREQALPLTPGLEDQLGHLSHRALAAGHGRHDSGRGLHLRHAVRHGDREPDPCEQREVRQVIADEGAFLPGEPAPLEQRLEYRELTRGGVLDHLVHGELPRAQHRGGGFPPGEPHDEESGGAEQADAEAVLDVKPLEFDRMIADHPDVDAIVGQDAVDVEADEFEAAGGRGVEHCHLRARARGAAGPSLLTTTPPCPWDLAAAVPPARAACHTWRAMLTMPASWSSGIMFGPSDGARSGSGCVSRKKPSAPAAAAA